LQDKQLGIDAALAFGGPTCTVYSNLTREDTRFPNRYTGYAAEAEHTQIIRQLAVARKNLHDLKSSKHLKNALGSSSRNAAAHRAVAAVAAVAKRDADSSSTQQELAAASHVCLPLLQRQQQQRPLLPPMAAALLAASQAQEQLAVQAAALAAQRRELAAKACNEVLRDTSALLA
jgi:pyridoxal/pyridoxine/pyridoxamine kinase